MRALTVVTILTCLACLPALAQPAGFESLFNGRDLSGWRIPAGDNGHWKVLDGVIDYDAQSEAKENKNLFSKKEYGDFVLRVEWRIKATPYLYPKTRIMMPDGEYKKDENGKIIEFSMPDSDSGILLRGGPQINIWCWPQGSGEIWSVRNNKELPPDIRGAAVPRLNADHNIGEWNCFEITLQGDRVTVVLNGHTVIDGARIPGIAARGPVGLQHHGRMQDGKWVGPPSLVQFRNLFIKEL